MSGRQKAEVWQYWDPGHRDHGTWSWQLLAAPWDQAVLMDRYTSNIVDVPASDVTYATWREAFDTALRYVEVHRFASR